MIALVAAACRDHRVALDPRSVTTPTPTGSPTLPKPTDPGTTDSGSTSPTPRPSPWDDLGPCQPAPNPVPLPPPVPATCVPAGHAWTSGPIAGLATGHVIGDPMDGIGSIRALRPSGSAFGLAVGAPRNQAYGTSVSGVARAVWFGSVVGHHPIDAGEVVRSESDATGSTGSQLGTLSPSGPLLVPDSENQPLGGGELQVIDLADPERPSTRFVGYLDTDDCGNGVSAADFDGDGITDPAVACSGAGNGHIGFVAALTPLGGATTNGSEWAPFFRIDGTVPDFGEFAWQGMAALDLDHDGLQDFMFGEYYASGYDWAGWFLSGPHVGRCSVAQDAVALTGTPDVFANPGGVGTGDLDGDGAPELVVPSLGYPAWPPAVPDPLPGRVFVIRDAPAASEPIADASWLVFEDLVPEDGFGAAAVSGDFNGDGCADLAVGAPGSLVTAAVEPTRVLVFFGPFTPATVPSDEADVVLEGTPGDGLGRRMEVADFDGDGVDDLAVAATEDAEGGPYAGAIWIVTGGR
jgi:hypothetical protein